MNTNMIGLRWFKKYLRPCALDKSSLSIGRLTLQACLGPELPTLVITFTRNSFSENILRMNVAKLSLHLFLDMINKFILHFQITDEKVFKITGICQYVLHMHLTNIG